MIASFLAILGFSYFIEFFILGVWLGYEYYPGIFRNLNDYLLGNIVSQISLSSATLLVIHFNLSFLWFFLFSGIFALVEMLFLELGIYKHIWWNTWYTFLGLPLFFGICKLWIKSLLYQKKAFAKYVALMFAVYAVYSASINWPFQLTGLQYFSTGFYPDPIRDHAVVYGIYAFFLINIMINLQRSSLRLSKKLILVLCLYLVQAFLMKLNILHIKQGLYLIITTIDFVSMYFLIWLLDYCFEDYKRLER